MVLPPINRTTGPAELAAAQRRRKRLITLLAYVVLLCADIAFSHWDELFGQENCTLIRARHWYQRVVTLGYRKPRPHFVRVVTVQPPQDPCGYRLLLSQLVDRIVISHPMMIVLDYSFSPHNCAQQTYDLQHSIDSAASQVPVVFGRPSSVLQEVEDRHRSDLEALEKAGFTSRDQAVWPSDISANGHTELTGLYRLDCDTRRIPTHWSVFEKIHGEWVHSGTPMSTIALTAALLYDPSVANQLAPEGRDNPFTSFIPEDAFRPLKAEEVLSGKSSPAEWQLARRIVMVGDEVTDIHESVVGRVPGVVLQANYLESLLDDRYFRSLGTVSGTAVTFLCLLTVAIVFDQTEKANRALFRSTFVLLILVSTSYFALVHLGRLFTFWLPCVPAVVLACIEKLIAERRSGP